MLFNLASNYQQIHGVGKLQSLILGYAKVAQEHPIKSHKIVAVTKRLSDVWSMRQNQRIIEMEESKI